MLLWLFSCIIGLAGSWAMLRRLDGEERGRSPILVVLAAGSVIAFGASTLYYAVPDGRLRLTLEALRFSPELETFSVGGSQANDELFIPAPRNDPSHPVEAEVLQFNRNGARVELAVDTEARANAVPAVVSVNGVFAGSVPVSDGTIICAGVCQNGQGIRFTYDGRVNALVASGDGAGRGPELPRRSLLLIFPMPQWTPYEHIFPLRFFAPEFAARGALNSFLYRDREGQLHLIDLDSSIHIAAPTAAAEVEDTAHSGLCFQGVCAPSSRVIVSTVDFGRPPAEDGAISRRSRLIERRSFKVSVAEDGETILQLDTPDFRELTAAEITTEEARQNALGIQGEPWVRLGARELDADSSISQVSFRFLGGAFRETLDHRLFLRRDQPTLAHGAEMTTLTNGDTIRLGEPASAIVRVLQFDVSWPAYRIALIVILLGGLVSLAATWRARSVSGATLMLFATLDLLVTLRVLIAVQAAYVDPVSIEAQHAPSQALAGYLLAPLVLSLFCRETYATPIRLGAHAIFVVVAGFYVEQTTGALNETWRTIGGVIVGAALLLAVTSILASRVPRAWLDEIDLTAPRAMASRLAKLSVAICAFGIIAVVVRVVPLIFLGAQEEIPGVGARLSLLYVPLGILTFAALFAALERTEKRFRLYLIAAGLMLAIYVGPVLLTGDIGSSLYALPVALAGFAFASRRLAGNDRRISSLAFAFVGAVVAVGAVLAWVSDPVFEGATTYVLITAFVVGCGLGGYAIYQRGVTILAVPALAAAAVIVLVNVAPSFPMANASRIEAAAQTETTEDDLELLADSQQFNSGLVRVLSVIDRQRLDEVGTTRAESQREALAHWADHSRRWSGEGLLTIDAPTSLRRFHMDDNVTSVHLMGAFGRLGAGALVFVLFLVLAIASQRRADEGADDDMAYYVTFLSVATLAVVSAYMVLGNLEAAPFTGRNFYMLAVRSTSDYVEALTLFCLALTGLWWRRRQ
jgi:hypothetical protein